MQVDQKITLANNKSYGLLLDAILENKRYFLAVELDEKENPTSNFKVLKEVIKDNKTYISYELNPIILNKLLEDYNLQLEDEK